MTDSVDTPMTTEGQNEEKEDQKEVGDKTQDGGSANGSEDQVTEDTPNSPKGTNIETVDADYSLFDNPPDLGTMRQRLFELEDPIDLTLDEFNRYLPFVDNVWRKLRSADAPDSNGAEWYWCRLRKPAGYKPHVPKPTPEGKTSRRRRNRDETTCGMAMVVNIHEGNPKRCTITRGNAKGEKHTHDLDHMDANKRNSGIMDTARRETNRAFLPTSVFEKMQQEPDKMEEAGGKHMKVSDVRNVQYAWRQENPDVLLKAHRGFHGGARPGPRGRRSHAAQSSPAPPRLISTESILPVGTLQYPEHARTFLQPYLPDPFAARTRPHITLTWASSLDSRIALMPGMRTAISGPETKAMTHYLRSRHDAIVIGVGTAIADDPALNCRLAGVGGYGGKGTEHQPRPIIIDPKARLPIRPDMNVLKVVEEGRAKAPWIVVAPGINLNRTAVSTLKAAGGEYLMINDYVPEKSFFSWEAIFNVLFREGLRSIMIEGGAAVLSELLKPRYASLIDSVILTVAPTFFSHTGLPVSPPPTFDEHNRPIASRLHNITWQPMGDADVVMCGKVHMPMTNGFLPGIEEFSQPRRPQNPPPP